VDFEASGELLFLRRHPVKFSDQKKKRTVSGSVEYNKYFSQPYRTSWYYQSYFHQLMHKRIALKVVLKFTLKQLQHVSA